jgi:tetratricopeptide (TPR) repeat protein
VLAELAFAYGEAGEFEECVRFAGEAAELAERLAEPVKRWRALVQRVKYDFYRQPEGALERGRPVVESAISALESMGEHRAAAYAWIVLGEMDYYLGRLEAESAAAVRAAAHAAQVGDDRLALLARVTALASQLWSDTPLSQVLSEGTSILERARELGRRLPEAQALGIIGRALAMQGELDEGRRLVAESRAIVHELGRVAHEAGASHWAATVEWSAGDYAGVERVLAEGAEVLEAIGERAMLSTSYSDIAVALHHQGRLDEAEITARRAIELTASDDVAALISTRVALALLDHSAGNRAAALAAADEALAIADGSEYELISAWARYELADLIREERGAGAAAELLAAALAFYERKEAHGIARRVRQRLSQLDFHGEGETDSSAAVRLL